MKKRLLVVMVFLLPMLGMRGQTIKPLSIGDTVPDILLSNIINYPVSKIQLSKLRGKLIILDFWATWCGACVNGFPKFDKLQRKYKGKLEVFAVAIEDDFKIKTFVEKYKQRAGLSFAFITNDSLLSKTFPHQMVPHEVWIDSAGVVYKITDESYVTEENINAYMRGTAFHAVVKKDLLNYDKDSPLLKSQNKEVQKGLLFHSALFSFLGAGSTTARILDTTSNLLTYKFTDLPILDLYWGSINPRSFGTGIRKRTILEVKEKGKYLLGNQQPAEWWAKNSYCYEISATATTPDSLFNLWMCQDLNRYFNLNGRIETRKTKVLELSLLNPALLQTKGANPSYKVDPENHKIVLKNKPLDDLLYFLNTYTITDPDLPIVNAISLKGNIDIALDVPNNCTVVQLISLLKPFGATVMEREKTMKMFVLSDAALKLKKQPS